jgi:hypothetical protein
MQQGQQWPQGGDPSMQGYGGGMQGGDPSMGMQGQGMQGGGHMGGQMERIFPAVKLRGLPFDVAEDDLRMFLVRAEGCDQGASGRHASDAAPPARSAAPLPPPTQRTPSLPCRDATRWTS